MGELQATPIQESWHLADRHFVRISYGGVGNARQRRSRAHKSRAGSSMEGCGDGLVRTGMTPTGGTNSLILRTRRALIAGTIRTHERRYPPWRE